MSKHKTRYILPLLAVMASAACIGAAGSSEKAANAVKPKQEKNLCPEPIDQMDEDCLRLTLLDFEIALNKKYEDLFRRAATKACCTKGAPEGIFWYSFCPFSSSVWGAWSVAITSIRLSKRACQIPSRSCSVFTAGFHLISTPFSW